MIITNLLTRYILAPIWQRIFIFIVFYFVVRELHFMDLDFSVTECMPAKKKILSGSVSKTTSETQQNDNTASDLKAEAKNSSETITLKKLAPFKKTEPIQHTAESVEKLLLDYEQKRESHSSQTQRHSTYDDSFVYFNPMNKKQQIYHEYAKFYSLQEQLRKLLPHKYPVLKEKFDQIQAQYGEIFRYESQYEDEFDHNEIVTHTNYYKGLSNPGGPIYKALLTDQFSLQHAKQRDRLLLYTLWEKLSILFSDLNQEGEKAWKNLRNDPERDYRFFQTIIRSTDHEFLNLTNKIRDLESAFPSLVAESKSSIIKETHESIGEIINTKINDVESRMISRFDSRISVVEEQQKTLVSFEFIEQLKNILIDKQETIRQNMQQSLLEIKEEQKFLASTAYVDELIEKLSEKQKNIREGVQKAVLDIKSQQEISQNELFTLKKTLTTSIEELNFKQEQLQHKNQQALVNLEIKQQALQRDLVTGLRNSFDRKLDMTNNEILDLKNQNVELQRTVAQHVAESKGQQELIDNVRKSFEKKMNAKDLIINQLVEEKNQLSKTVTEMKQAQDKMAHDVSILRDHIDVLRHFQHASMHRASLEAVADVKTAVLPRSFSDIK